MVLNLGKDIEKVIARTEGGIIREERVIKAFVKEDSGKPTDTFDEGALVINMAENRLYVQVNGAAQQPVSHWKMNETSGTSIADSGSGGHTGTASSANIWDTEGKLDGCANWDDQYDATVTGHADFDLDGSFTWEFWCFFNSFDKTERYLLGRAEDNTHTNDDSYALGTNNDPMDFFFFIKETGVSETVEIHIADHVNAQEWFHVAIVGDRSGGTLKMYINGEVVSNVSLSKDPSAAFDVGETVYLGNWTGSTPDSQPPCKMDDVKFWKEARSQDQVRNDSLRGGGLVWAYTNLIGA